jgi:ribosomal protein L7Ae-like RNA K-turn-binding protein
VSLIQKERAQLINLAEDVYPESFKKKNKVLFPKYIIIRELEE